jgi:hypothetical protein
MVAPVGVLNFGWMLAPRKMIVIIPIGKINFLTAV